MSDQIMFVHAAVYPSKADARADLDEFENLTSAGVVGARDTAIVTKKPNGKVSVRKHGTPAKRAGVIGAIVGAVVGFLFPLPVLVGTLVGGAAGAISGKLWGGVSRSNLEELGETLDAGESALVIVGDSRLDEYIEKSLERALRRIRREFKADLKELEEALAATS